MHAAIWRINGLEWMAKLFDYPGDILVCTRV